MTEYQILDEPKPKHLARLAISPVVILLAAMILPFLISLPPYLRFGVPLVWIVLNSFWIGSPLKWKTALIAGVCYFAIMALPFVAVFTIVALGEQEYIKISMPYIRIANQAAFFFALYWLVFMQQASYEIFSYLKSLRD